MTALKAQPDNDLKVILPGSFESDSKYSDHVKRAIEDF